MLRRIGLTGSSGNNPKVAKLLEEGINLFSTDAGGISVTRNSNAFNPYNGTTVSTNIVRTRPLSIVGRDFDMKLIETSATNLFANRSSYTSWVKYDSVITPGQSDAFGGNNAILVQHVLGQGAASSGNPRVECGVNVLNNGGSNVTTTSAGNNLFYCYSAYIKQGTTRYQFISIMGGYTRYGENFIKYDWQTNTISQTSSPNPAGWLSTGKKNMGNGWVRIWGVIQNSSNPDGGGVGIPGAWRLTPKQICSDNGIYDGDVNDPNNSGYFDRIQFEQVNNANSFPTSYILTGDTSASRNSDTVLVNTTGLPGGGIGSNNGTVILYYIPECWTGNPQVGSSVSFTSSTEANPWHKWEIGPRLTSNNTFTFNMGDGTNSNRFLTEPQTLSDGILSSCAISWNVLNDSTRTYLNGSFNRELTEPSITNFTNTTEINMGRLQSNSWIGGIYFDRQLTDAEISILSNKLITE